MALLYDQESEVRCIKTLTDDSVPSNERSTLLGKLSKEHFHNAPTLEAFKRIDTLAKKRFEIVDLSALVADPTIDEDLRDILRTQVRKAKPCKNKKQIASLLEVLERYRKIRTLYAVCKDVFEELEQPQIDVDDLLARSTEAIAKANANLSEEQFFLNFGANDTSAQVVDKVINRETKPRIKTGFAEYDKRNGGLPEKGVVIISATTSGGKSVLAMNLLVYLYLKQKRSVCRISLEMDDEQETRRLASHITKIAFNKFKENKLNSGDKAKIKEAFEKFREHGLKHDITYSTISPTRAVNIHDVFRMVKPFGYKIIAIDYIGLLNGMDHDSQWFQLSEIAAISKRYSTETNSLIIILAQLDDTTEKLRYSKGIKEHADTMFQWNYTKPEQRELRILPIRVEKDRDGEVFSFELAERYDIMTAENMPESRANDYDGEPEDDAPPKSKKKDKGSKKEKSGKSKSGKSKRRTVDDDDTDDEPSSYALA